jgi:hypothetical protein
MHARFGPHNLECLIHMGANGLNERLASMHIEHSHPANVANEVAFAHETEGPSGHIEGLTLRLYNPEAHQWSLYWANSKDGAMGGPPNVGEFKNGRGEFYCQDTFNGCTR